MYYGNQRKLEYDFIVKPGADYKQIRLNIQGADSISIDDDGNLVIHTEGGDIVQHKPVVYQTDTAKESITTKAQNENTPYDSPFPDSPLAKGGWGDFGFLPLSSHSWECEKRASPSVIASRRIWRSDPDFWFASLRSQ